MLRNCTCKAIPERMRRYSFTLIVFVCLGAARLMAQSGDFNINQVRLTEDNIVIEWESTNGFLYTVQWSSNLTSGSTWTNLTGFVDIPGSTGFLAATDSVATARTIFYRVARKTQPPYAHTIALDGVNDFTTNETFQSSSSGYTGYISWDANYLYLGMTGLDIAAASATRVVTAYIGGSPGTTTGLMYNTQQPSLPFAARYHLAWQTDNTSPKLYVFDGSTWVVSAATVDAAKSGSFVEFRIARADLGSPSSIRVHLCMLSTAAFAEWSYAAVPSLSFVDSYDPDYTRYFDFDLLSPAVPAAYPPMP